MEGSSARPLEPLPPGFLTLPNGKTVQRRHAWLKPGDRIRCAMGHSISLPRLHEGSITLQCKARTEAAIRQAPCGCLIYYAATVPHPLWADVSELEAEEIARKGLSVTGVMRYLSIPILR